VNTRREGERVEGRRAGKKGEEGRDGECIYSYYSEK